MLRQALYELEFEVEHCPEIFAAVERLTSRSFDVIVADFDEGLEAGFLLKTSRELKANCGAFTLAITSDREANAEARKAGADLVLNKPIVTEVAKYGLLTCDAFLRSMKNWLPKLQIAGSMAPANPGPVQAAPFERPPVAAAPAGPRLTHDFSRRPPALPVQKSTDPLALWPYADSPGRFRSRSRSSAPVLLAAVAMVFLSVGYVFSEPTRSQAVVGSMATACEKALARTKSWLGAPSRDEDVSSEWAQNDSPPLSRKPTHIRVTEIHDPSEAPAPRPISPPSAEPVPEPAQVARATPNPIIPQSLRTPIPAVADAPNKLGASLLSALQPVDLPEELSNKMILERVEPSYPAQAARVGLQGPVVLRAWIGRDGRIQDLKLIRGSFLLGQAAYQAVKQWRYKPYLLNGQAVEAQTYVTVDFKLP